MPPSRFNVVTPLTKHPHQTACTNNDRPRERLSPPRRPEDEPLAPEVRKSNHICPDRQLVERRVVDVVGRVETDYGGQKRPCAKCAARQPGYVRGLFDRRVGAGGVVDARGVG